MNTQYARRCIGHINEVRCDYYFEFKECPNDKCTAQNDIAARHCRICETEIIDPNAKLKLEAIKNPSIQVDVLKAQYGISGTSTGFRINCAYRVRDSKGHEGTIFEHYSPISEKSKNVFYGQFVRKHCPEASKWYIHLNNRIKVEEMLQTAGVPLSLMIAKEEEGTRIKKKIFE